MARVDRGHQNATRLPGKVADSGESNSTNWVAGRTDPLWLFRESGNSVIPHVLHGGGVILQSPLRLVLVLLPLPSHRGTLRHRKVSWLLKAKQQSCERAGFRVRAPELGTPGTSGDTHRNGNVQETSREVTCETNYGP